MEEKLERIEERLREELEYDEGRYFTLEDYISGNIISIIESSISEDDYDYYDEYEELREIDKDEETEKWERKLAEIQYDLYEEHREQVDRIYEREIEKLEKELEEITKELKIDEDLSHVIIRNFSTGGSAGIAYIYATIEGNYHRQWDLEEALKVSHHRHTMTDYNYVNKSGLNQADVKAIRQSYN